MAWVSLTRLRVRSVFFMPGFLLYAARSKRQVERAKGFIGGGLLSDRERTFWTMSVWESREAMLGYMTSGAHRQAMPKLMDWCDEASVAGWAQEEPSLPGWSEAELRMRTEGRPSKVRRPSEAHRRSVSGALEFREARTTGAVGIKPA